MHLNGVDSVIVKQGLYLFRGRMDKNKRGKKKICEDPLLSSFCYLLIAQRCIALDTFALDCFFCFCCATIRNT